jgi:hypothetical protein
MTKFAYGFAKLKFAYGDARWEFGLATSLAARLLQGFRELAI